MIETYDYDNDSRVASIILYCSLLFYVTVLILSFFLFRRFYQKKLYHYFWIFMVLLLLPLYVPQIFFLLFAIIYLVCIKN